MHIVKKLCEKREGMCVVKPEQISICNPRDEYLLIRRNNANSWDVTQAHSSPKTLLLLLHQIGNFPLPLCIAGLCVCVCVCEPGNRAGSVVSAGVTTAKTIMVEVCVGEHCSPRWSISLGVSICEWFSKSCWSHWEPAAVNKHKGLGSAVARECLAWKVL